MAVGFDDRGPAHQDRRVAGGEMRESSRAHRAWMDYLAMPDAERSLDRLLERYLGEPEGTPVPTRRRHRLHQWSATHGWQLRLQHIANEERAAAEQKRIADTLARQDAHITDLFDVGAKLLTRANAMLEVNLAKTRWTAADIARYIELWDRIMRYALDASGAKLGPTDIDKLIDDQLDREGVQDEKRRSETKEWVKAQFEMLGSK